MKELPTETLDIEMASTVHCMRNRSQLVSLNSSKSLFGNPTTTVGAQISIVGDLGLFALDWTEGKVLIVIVIGVKSQDGGVSGHAFLQFATNHALQALNRFKIIICCILLHHKTVVRCPSSIYSNNLDLSSHFLEIVSSLHFHFGLYKIIMTRWNQSHPALPTRPSLQHTEKVQPPPIITNHGVKVPSICASCDQYTLEKLGPNSKCSVCSSRWVEPPQHSGSPIDVRSYTNPFVSFITENPTVFHAVSSVGKTLESHGFVKLSERDSWADKLEKGGKYFFERNGSSVLAFTVGKNYVPGNGASVIASHIDALTTRLKPISTLSTKAGYVQLGVAPYAGALNSTWWDRDLGIGGRVLVRNGSTGKIETRLVKLGWPIARIPTLAPHFGAAADLSNPNKETQMVPIIGLDDDSADEENLNESANGSLLEGAGTFAATQPPRLVKAIASEMNIQDCEFLLERSPLPNKPTSNPA